MSAVGLDNKKEHFGYHANSREEPDYSKPMTKEELIDLYWAVSDDEPTMLADIYKNFHLFDRVEFIIFENRLCSAILLTRSFEKELDNLIIKLRKHFDFQIKNSPGWKAELDMSHHASLEVIEDSFLISIGSTIVTAVAALEGLLVDLHPSDQELPSGLYDLLEGFLDRHKDKLSKSKRKHIRGVGLVIGKRRNTFAHVLDGSYWENDQSIKKMFTKENMEDTLFKVCEIAVVLDKALESSSARKTFERL